MITTIETITPALAAAYLEKNTKNRPVHPRQVAYLTSAMQSGRWKLTHEAIAFDKSDRLIDGQHRLLAVKMSGVTVKMPVSRQCDADTFSVIGDGARRTAADIVAMAGHKNASRLSASAGAAIRGLAWGEVNKAHIEEFIRTRFGEILRSLLDACEGSGDDQPISPIFGAALRGISSGELTQEKVEKALHRYSTETYTGEHDPMRILRRAIRRESRNTRGVKNARHAYACAVYALRAVESGKDIRAVYAAEKDFQVDFSK